MGNFSSRKFLMFLIVLIVATLGWAYALLYKADQLATISTFIITLLGAYSSVNLTDTHLANKLTIESAKTGTPPAPCAPPDTKIDGGQANG